MELKRLLGGMITASLVLFALQHGARAHDWSICNKTRNTAHVATAYSPNVEKASTTTKGWLTLEPGQCDTVVRGTDDHLLYWAKSDTTVWDGSTSTHQELCINPTGNFTLESAQDIQLCDSKMGLTHRLFVFETQSELALVTYITTDLNPPPPPIPSVNDFGIKRRLVSGTSAFSRSSPNIVLDAPLPPSGDPQAIQHGTPVQVYTENNGTGTLNQWWYYNPDDGHIRSAVRTDLVLDVAGISGPVQDNAVDRIGGTKVILYPETKPATPNQRWIESGGRFMSDLNNHLVLTVRGVPSAPPAPGTGVEVSRVADQLTPNQAWIECNVPSTLPPVVGDPDCSFKGVSLTLYPGGTVGSQPPGARGGSGNDDNTVPQTPYRCPPGKKCIIHE